MALIVVNLTDTFNDWRLKTNSSISQIGDLATLTASNSASIVGALNGMMEELKDDLTPQLGGPLDVNGKTIVSISNGNITLTPDGTGKVVITKGDYTGSLNTATTAITQAAGNDTTAVATTAFVKAAVESEDTLEEMNDTTMSGLANLDVLQYKSSGTTWENKTISAAGIPTKGFTVAMAVALG